MMRWRPRDPMKWKSWFAWYPVEVVVHDSYCMVWLEWLERRPLTDKCRYFIYRFPGRQYGYPDKREEAHALLG